ncbi:histidine phosphotransferase family protein [Pseudaestuariivita sp.]|uniref:histidine phosphotransferase family protein n=1 Tax=Pseudaestuariivita sp. TaxID=2211669 RepID=UPI00405A2502
MTQATPTLSALLASRICHDLISPIGAINNGLELMTMTASGPASPEMVLIQDSCRSASARIRFFRIAFGLATMNQRMGAGELRSILADFTEGARLRVTWGPDGDAAREGAQLAFLGILCCETSMPFGGTIRVDESGGRWKLSCEATSLRHDPALWAALDGTAEVATPAHVHFAVLRSFAEAAGRAITFEATETSLQLMI